VQRPGSPPFGCGRACVALAACLWLAGAPGCASVLSRLPHGLGSVKGELRFTGGPEPLPELGPVVVYLEREDGNVREHHRRTLIVSDGDDALLGQELAVLVRGQSLRFASQSGLEHRLFTVSGPQRIDVEVPANGRSRPVRMERLGWMRFYCSLHQDETWDAFVAPSLHYARLGSNGAYRIAFVPPGDYKLSIWSTAIDGTVRRIRVGLLTSSLETIWLDPAKVAW
jgi:hypothetical protein